MTKKLTARSISRHLDRPIGVEVLDVIDSTNTEAKRRVAAGLSTPLLLIARTQTAGRGRLGRTFCSPDGAGLYMSLVLHPEMAPENLLTLTSAAAVAVCEAIESMTALTPKIKWVNDVYLNDKKVCGILTEGVSDPASGKLRSMVVGIGINLTPAALPPDVAAIATSIGSDGATVDPNRLAATICDRLLEFYENLPRKDWLDGYRRRSWLDGKSVIWRRAGGNLDGEVLGNGTVIGIGDDGELILATESGNLPLTGGEVTVRVEE